MIMLGTCSKHMCHSLLLVVMQKWCHCYVCKLMCHSCSEGVSGTGGGGWGRGTMIMTVVCVVSLCFALRVMMFDAV